MSGFSRTDLDARTDDIEAAYEYFLAYASQGLATESAPIRDHLRKFDAAVSGLGEFFTSLVAESGRDVASYRDFIAVIDRDARSAQAAVRMVLAQPMIHSQIIDNLNANIHIRALLTGLFLIDEILKA